MARHNDLCGGTRVARTPLYRTVTRGPGARVCPVWFDLVTGSETRLPEVPGARPMFLGCRALR